MPDSGQRRPGDEPEAVQAGRSWPGRPRQGRTEGGQRRRARRLCPGAGSARDRRREPQPGAAPVVHETRRRPQSPPRYPVVRHEVHVVTLVGRRQHVTRVLRGAWPCDLQEAAIAEHEADCGRGDSLDIGGGCADGREVAGLGGLLAFEDARVHKVG
jgi:hypothetical protein